MKSKEKTVKVKVRPKRIAKANRKQVKRAQKAAEELLLCKQAIEFHKAYLAIEMEHEESKYEELQARLMALQPTPEIPDVFETPETPEIPETFEAIEAEMKE